MVECVLFKHEEQIIFTSKKNLPKIINFVETTQGEIFLAQTEKENILDLKQLVKATCNPEYKPPHNNYKIIKKITCLDKYRKLSKSLEIKNTIFEQFFSGDSVSLKNLKNKFKIPTPSLCNYLSFVRKDLEKKGFNIKKEGSSYQLIKK